jgi:hypothetical protein
MSAGPFERTRYQATYLSTAIHPIRVQPETIALAEAGAPTNTNDPPALSITIPISAVVSKSDRGLGLRPRKFNLELTGTPPTGYSPGSRVSVPILTEAFYESIPVNDEVTYLSTTWQVISKTPESVR